ncbi:MAG: aspartate carbamoyltransferase [Candidatus ainarchaeum sp.]|nr:aspartate carbamoyltransferase [Candidatus ainarchaeum sp.]
MDLISFRDLDKGTVEKIFGIAEDMDHQLERKKVEKLEGIMATLFFEPSTRTKLSFQSSAERLGLQVVDFLADRSSLKKGESFTDTIRTVDGYCDVIAMRHPAEGAARMAAEVAEAPVLNGGDGANQHPTQTLLDLYTIRKLKGKIAGLNVHLVGDLKHARTMHSLVYGLGMFGAKVTMVAPKGLELEEHIIHEAEKKFNFKMESRGSIDLKDADVLYVCRVQEERFADKYEAAKVKKEFTISADYIKNGKKDLVIMHPLPKIDEIPPDVDAMPQAKYFEQAKNGIPVRMACIKMLLEGA